MNAGTIIEKVSEVIELPPAATWPRVVNINKGTGEGKKPSPRKPVTDEKIKLKINGGHFGTAKKLQDHGFKLGKCGIIRCNLCPKII